MIIVNITVALTIMMMMTMTTFILQYKIDAFTNIIRQFEISRCFINKTFFFNLSNFILYATTFKNHYIVIFY